MWERLRLCNRNGGNPGLMVGIGQWDPLSHSQIYSAEMEAIAVEVRVHVVVALRWLDGLGRVLLHFWGSLRLPHWRR